jgi:SpoIID/LytB domain protein
MMEIPYISIGIIEREGLKVTFHSPYRLEGCAADLCGAYRIAISGDNIVLANDSSQTMVQPGSVLLPLDEEAGSFTIHEVTIGINFHWQRNEDQRFKGRLKLMVDNGRVLGINILSIEDYLISVISSEMSATSSMELLKAHSVISRSWLLAQIQKTKSLKDKSYQSSFEDDHSRIKWYDREDHLHFDVCADDHCQRYQGITRASTQAVTDAVNSTRGQLLMYDGAICDARFSKCCGGVSELFENCWEPVNHPYLQKVVDNDSLPKGYKLDLTNETVAQQWILGTPEAFCNTNDKKVLSQVLNDYDQETNDFFRWKVTYSQQQLSELVKRRTGIDFGTITGLEPVERGESSRLTKLRIIGTKRTMVIGKELEIRKALSESHLYSSAFVVAKNDIDGVVTFNLTGAGWGHGVGLCQIGAAMMGAKGYDYESILMHYFRGASLERKY